MVFLSAFFESLGALTRTPPPLGRWPSPPVSHRQEIIVHRSSKRGGAAPLHPTRGQSRPHMCVHILCICPPALTGRVAVLSSGKTRIPTRWNPSFH